jgi:RimJ/RimL family protein N-acetyltransferase
MVKKISNNKKDIDSLLIFLQNAGTSLLTFRYFSKRPLESIQNHYCTLLYFDEYDFPVGYGHLDPQDELIWLGICVAQNHLKKGYGNEILFELCKEAENQNVKEILLKVDKQNLNAINLYKKFDFVIFSEIDENCFQMKKIMNG